jgi:hypothetical protein
VIGALRWIGFAAGLTMSLGIVIGVMKTFIVPRRSWSLIPWLIGRYAFRLFHGIAIRLRSFDLADRVLGFLAPVVIIGILSSFLASFVLSFALLLLPWAELTFGEALHESGSSVFTLGFASTDKAVPVALDIFAGATGMIFVALTIGYLPTLYGEVTKREVLVKQLEGWTGVPSWGPEILAQFAEAGARHQLPMLYRSWDTWAAHVADSHMKYPVLTHFRLPRAKNHWLVALLAVMDAAALEVVLRPDEDQSSARLLLKQGRNTLQSVAYPIRRIEPKPAHPGIDESDFHRGVEHASLGGYPVPCFAESAWEKYADLRSQYAPLAYQLAYWTIAAPAPWTGDRAGFSETASGNSA